MTFAAASLRNSQRIYEQWENFQKGKDVDRTIIREFIYRSWQRCRQYGVDPLKPVSKVASPAQLREQTVLNAPLIESSRVIMEKIFSMISGTMTTMVLANSMGMVLRVLPEDSELHVPGMFSREEYLGTIGIGTCLEEKRQIEIFGAEHYCRYHHGLVCSAAPIFGHNHDVIGILGVTTAAESFHSHTSGMLGTAVYAISQQMHLRELLEEQHTLIELLEEGIIALDASKNIRTMNSNALKLLKLKSTPVGSLVTDVIEFSRSTRAFLDEGTPFNDVDTTLIQRIDNVSLPCVMSGALNKSSGSMLITLKEMGRMRDFANRMTGMKPTFQFKDILGNSANIEQTLNSARRIAPSNSTVLLLGESGTGKELFAQAIHNASRRAGKPFVVVNCGALPRELIQSELFGYTEGSFTGASRHGKPGKFELADEGTIFLDEIGEMPMDVQVNLLRLLQSREVMRIGGKTARIVDVRVIAATNRDLLQLIREHRFREDLYYRLNVFPISLPPLRDRTGDIEVLARYFIRKSSQQAGKHVEGLSQEAVQMLNDYSWPGNIRELENVMERAVYLTSGPVISASDLPSVIKESSLRHKNSIKVHNEREHILDVLEKNGWNIKNAVQELNIPRSTLYYKIKKYNISRHDRNENDRSDIGREIRNLSKEQIDMIVNLAKYLKDNIS